MENWYEDAMIESENEDDGVIKEYDITSTPNDFNISTLFNLINNGIIKMPPFQRNYVWDIKRASKLIESVILGLPIPQVFLYEKGKNNFFVIDGQQKVIVNHYRHIDGIKRAFANEPDFLLTKPEMEIFVADTQAALEILGKDPSVRQFVQSITEKEAKERDARNINNNSGSYKNKKW